MTPAPEIAKYGHPLTDSDWAGLPMRLGAFPESGRVEALHGENDSVLIWSGGTSEVTIVSSSEGGPKGTTRHRFVRRSGKIDLLPRGTTLHEVSWKGEAQGCLSVNLPTGAVEQLFGDRTLGLPLQAGPRFNLDDAHVVDLAQRLMAQASQDQPLGASYVQSLSLALASYVTGRFSERAPLESGKRLPELTMTKLFAFIEENLDQNLGLVDLAAIAGYSPDHFARLFKRGFGVGPHRYLQGRRVERAKSLLRDRSLPIAHIALSCGFANQAHFSVVFKQHTGTTPGMYRRG